MKTEDVFYFLEEYKRIRAELLLADAWGFYKEDSLPFGDEAEQESLYKQSLTQQKDDIEELFNIAGWDIEAFFENM